MNDMESIDTHAYAPVGGVAVTDVAATTLAVRSYYSAARRATPFGCNGSIGSVGLTRIRWENLNGCGQGVWDSQPPPSSPNTTLLFACYYMLQYLAEGLTRGAHSKRRCMLID